MNKKILMGLFALCVLVSIPMTGIRADAAVGEEFTAKVDIKSTPLDTSDDIDMTFKVLTEDSTTGTVQVGNSTITAAIDGNNVDAIEIPKTVTRTINGVEYMYTVTSVGDYAFNECNQLITVMLPSTVTSIGNYAFNRCFKLSNINLNSSVTSIGNYAFSNCKSLTSIELPETLVSIGDGAFNLCMALSAVNIPSNVTSIGASVFNVCSNLASITVDPANSSFIGVDGVLYNKDQTTLIKYPQKKSGATYMIPESVTSIGNSSFTSCEALTTMAIPDSVTYIGASAFNGCTALTTVTFGENSRLERIWNQAFEESGITSINIPTTVMQMQGNVFTNCASLETVTFSNDSKLNIIAGSMFRGCTALTSINIPSSVTSIGGGTFRDCTSLSTIYFDGDLHQYMLDGIESIPNNASLNIYYDGNFPGAWGQELTIADGAARKMPLPITVNYSTDNLFYDGVEKLLNITVTAGANEMPTTEYTVSGNSGTELGKYTFYVSGTNIPFSHSDTFSIIMPVNPPSPNPTTEQVPTEENGEYDSIAPETGDGLNASSSAVMLVVSMLAVIAVTVVTKRRERSRVF